MNTTLRPFLLSLAGLVLAGASSPRSEPVSPGHPLHFARIGDACPTFSWSAVAGVGGYELVLYELPEDPALDVLSAEELQSLQPALREILPPTTSWTPDLDRCLTNERRYAWFVRTRGTREDDRASVERSWSEPRLFELTLLEPDSRPDPVDPARADKLDRPRLAGPLSAANDAAAHRRALGRSAAAPVASPADPGDPPGSEPLEGSAAALLFAGEVGVQATISNAAGAVFGVRGVVTSADPLQTSSGVYGESSADGKAGIGVIGVARAATGLTSGVFGVVQSPGGSGVLGRATAVTGFTRGVYGVSSSVDGRGVFGDALTTTGNAAGIVGRSYSAQGVAGLLVNEAGGDILRAMVGSNEVLRIEGSGDLFTDGDIQATTVNAQTAGDEWAVRGLNTQNSGVVWGVLGNSSSPAGSGVRGTNSATSGGAYGVRGESVAPGGRGVSGFASAASGANYGVHGQTQSTEGRGVLGVASSGTGATTGVYGQVQSADGVAGVFVNNGGGDLLSGLVSGNEVFRVDGSGALETAAVTAVSGSSEWAVRALSTQSSGAVWGLLGQSSSATGAGVRGTNSVASGEAIGVRGESPSSVGRGVYGHATATSGQNAGVYGQTQSTEGRGVVGIAGTATGSTFGVWGQVASPEGWGVYGIATASTGFTRGVLGASGSVNGRGVFGEATSQTGNTAGVVGRVASADGVAGLFINEADGGGDILRGQLVSGNEVFRVEGSGSVFADGSFNCGLASGCFNAGQGADVAERIDSVEPLAAGDLVEVDPAHPGRFRMSRGALSLRVIGVVSDQPAITLNNSDLAGGRAEVGSDRRPLVALVGIVPVRVSDEAGPIAPGDLLVSSSTSGVAMRCVEVVRCLGATVGKALEPHQRGKGRISMLVFPN